MEDYVIIGDELFEKHNTTHEPARIYMSFGCTTRETHLFRTQSADGIIGLGINGNRKLLIAAF
jgi:hypothetical protein